MKRGISGPRTWPGWQIGQFAALIFALVVPIATGNAESGGGTPGDSTVLRREFVLVRSPAEGVRMRTTVFRPLGEGRFPLLVMNHGSVQAAQRRALMRTPVFEALSHWFVQRGYVVAVPQRPGHGETGGPYLEDQHGCDRADYVGSGLATADSIEATIAFMRTQSYVRKDDIVVAGHSAGGWGSLALASRNPAGVKAIINFAGGRGGRSFGRADNNCAPDRLIAAAGKFGHLAREPTLWIYAQNDSYFGPDLSRRMEEAYRAAGGRVEFHLLPAFGTEGHRLVTSSEGVAQWAPLVLHFLGVRKDVAAH